MSSEVKTLGEHIKALADNQSSVISALSSISSMSFGKENRATVATAQVAPVANEDLEKAKVAALSLQKMLKEKV